MLREVILVSCLIMLAGLVAEAKTLTQVDLDRGAVPQPGDQVLLCDFAKLRPHDAFSKTSVRGKWWLRSYKTDGGQEGTMLMTVERDMDKPETCLVPQVAYPLSLKGWYEVWVATHRGPYGGGIDVRLTGDDCFLHIDPQQVAQHPKRPKPRVGAIVEINYKPAVDLTGQDLVIQQPFGSYESFHWGFCEASLAYVRLVKLSDEQVRAFQADQARQDRRIFAVDDDNFSRYWMWGAADKHAILRIFEPYRYHDLACFGLCMGAMASCYMPTPYTDLQLSNNGRLGDRRVNQVYKAFAKEGVDFLTLATERAHRYGFKLLPTWRMSAPYFNGPKFKELAKYTLKGDRNRFDFACPQVHDFYVKLVRYFLEKYDVDGFILDYTRHRIHFDKDQPDKVRYMNEFSARMRKMVDEVSKLKGRKLLLVASFTEAPYSRSQPLLEFQGIDVAAWVKEGYYDIIMPEGPNIDKYIRMTRGTNTRCFPRWDYTADINAKGLAPNIHDPTPKEDKKDRPINPHLGPDDLEASWLILQEKGAEGIYYFNNPEGMVGTRRIGHLDEVRERVKAAGVYGIVEGPSVTFAD
jgi:hypothetical protein